MRSVLLSESVDPTELDPDLYKSLLFAGVIFRHASVHGQAGEHGERTKRPFAPSGRGG
jgi:hypothetical protein